VQQGASDRPSLHQEEQALTLARLQSRGKVPRRLAEYGRTIA
jgi:hypothetical protein